MLGFASLLLVGGAAALWFRRAMAVRLPRNRTGFVAVWVGGALLGALALGRAGGGFDDIAATLAMIGGLFLTFTVSISRQKLGADAITVGATLPDVAAPDDTGETFPLTRALGKPLLLKFFRGHW